MIRDVANVVVVMKNYLGGVAHSEQQPGGYTLVHGISIFDILEFCLQAHAEDNDSDDTTSSSRATIHHLSRGHPASGNRLCTLKSGGWHG
jgi:hypothetical protein